MTAYSDSFTLHSQGHTDIQDITPGIIRIVQDSKIDDGIGLVFVAGSTAGITMVEYEPGLIQDLKDVFDRLAPAQGDHQYHHEESWNDGNGHSHVRASLIGPSLSFPISDGRPVLGTWQQIILIDFDVKARSREIYVKVVG